MNPLNNNDLLQTCRFTEVLSVCAVKLAKNNNHMALLVESKQDNSIIIPTMFVNMEEPPDKCDVQRSRDEVEYKIRCCECGFFDDPNEVQDCPKWESKIEATTKTPNTIEGGKYIVKTKSLVMQKLQLQKK